MHISCALFHTSRRHLPQKGGLRATSRQIIFFHFRFMHIMFRWFSAPKIYAAPAHAVTNMFHRLQLLLNATFLAHNETLLAPIPGRNSNGGEPPSKRLRACLNFAQVYFESYFRGYFSIFVRSIADYVTSQNRKTDRKETQNNLKNLKLRKI